MISPLYKCIFIEVPKTGSTSIRDIVGFSKKPHLDISELKSEMQEHVSWLSHSKGIKSKIYNALPKSVKSIYGTYLFNTYYKFGFVRNPWSRVVSLYLRNEGIQMKDKLSFEEFVNWIQNSSDTCIHPSTKKNQLDWFTDREGNVLVDFIGKFENLESDWDIISKKLGINKKLPHKNNTNSNTKHYSEFYTEETRDIIHNKFKVDIEYFGYTFEDKK